MKEKTILPDVTHWQAQWIWQRGHAWTVNYHGIARREFVLVGEPLSAVLHISAYTDYIIWVNGIRVGRGPEPNDPWWQTFDSYDIASHLRPGPNVVAVLAHNYAVGTHWHHRNRGGLIAQVEVTTAAGPQIIATDATWRLSRAACYAPNSPRQWWPAAFLETFDFRLYDERWLTAGFDDSAWDAPEVLGPVGTKPWTRLIARDIPLLEETKETPVSAEIGKFTLPRLHAVGFSDLSPPGKTGIVYAQGIVTLAEAREAVLHLECDDAFKLFLNGEQIAEQNYSEFFAATRVWRGKDEYDQIHDGMGHQEFFVPVTLREGENRLVVVVDSGPGGWGFLLAPCASSGRAVLDLPLEWTLTGPLESSGLWDSLDAVTDELPKLPSVRFSPAPETGIADYAAIMGYETRHDFAPVALNSLTLRAGEFCVLDMGKVTVGFPEFTFVANEEAILDIGYSQALRDDRRIEFSNAGRMKCVDRIFLRSGTQTYQPALRRTLRYIHLSCRQGEVTIPAASVYRSGYPVTEIGAFKCSDELLNRIYGTGIYTSKLLMQQGWQDCLKREQGTLNTSSFNYGGRGAACAFGDSRLTRKNIRQAIRTQNDSGWFDSHGISSPNSDEPTECLWLAVWLKDYLLYSGDREFAAEIFDNIEDNLRYFSKGINRYGLIEGRNRPLAWRGQGIYLDDSQLSGNYQGLYDGELSGLNMLYCAAMQSAAEIAAEIGLAERATYWSRRAETTKKSLQERYWDAERGLYRDWRDGDALATACRPVFQITALYFRLGDEAVLDALTRYLTDELGLPDENRDDYPLFTFGYYFYFLENLFRRKREDLAYELLRRYYGRWLELGGTAFGEFFQMSRFRGQPRMTEEYEIHAYGTSAHLHFYTNILGVQPIAPGFARVRIAPKPGDLTWARGAVATPLGAIEVSWERRDGAFFLDITLPKGCEGEAEIPSSALNGQVTINGEITRFVGAAEASVTGKNPE